MRNSNRRCFQQYWKITGQREGDFLHDKKATCKKALLVRVINLAGNQAYPLAQSSLLIAKPNGLLLNPYLFLPSATFGTADPLLLLDLVLSWFSFNWQLLDLFRWTFHVITTNSRCHSRLWPGPLLLSLCTILLHDLISYQGFNYHLYVDESQICNNLLIDLPTSNLAPYQFILQRITNVPKQIWWISIPFPLAPPLPLQKTSKAPYCYISRIKYKHGCHLKLFLF